MDARGLDSLGTDVAEAKDGRRARFFEVYARFLRWRRLTSSSRWELALVLDKHQGLVHQCRQTETR